MAFSRQEIEDIRRGAEEERAWEAPILLGDNIARWNVLSMSLEQAAFIGKTSKQQAQSILESLGWELFEGVMYRGEK